jgi:hypothetical protein
VPDPRSDILDLENTIPDPDLGIKKTTGSQIRILSTWRLTALVLQHWSINRGKNLRKFSPENFHLEAEMKWINSCRSEMKMPIQLPTFQLATLQLATLQLATLQLVTFQLATLTTRHPDNSPP